MKKAKTSPLRKQWAHRLSLSVSGFCPPHPTIRQLRQIIQSALMPHIRQAYIGVMLADTAQSSALNQKWRHQNHPTNVLSFSLSEAAPNSVHSHTVLIGDLVLCTPLVVKEAAQQQQPLKAYYALLIIHGMLHLQGYHHETNQKAAALMLQLEYHILQKLGYQHPYVTHDMLPVSQP